MLAELTCGVKDSCNYFGAVKALLRCPGVHKPLLLSIWLTGFVFLGSIVLSTYLIDPLLNENPNFNRIFSTLYYLLWLFPIYLTCFILNIFSYSDIALAVYTTNKGRPRSPGLSFSRAIACEIHRGFIMGVYIIAMSVLSLIPYTEIFIISLLSWLYSFYCFEYKWVLEGNTITKEVEKLENNAIYYLGFGLPFALITYWFPGMSGNGIWLLLFPVFMVTAILSKTPKKPTIVIPVFQQINKLCDTIEVFLLGRLFN